MINSRSNNGNLLLIAGVAASGKTHFGHWLEENRSFIHIDYEKEINGRMITMGLHDGWFIFLTSQNSRPFLESLFLIGKPIVFNWGFPDGSLKYIQTLKKNGFDIWWFRADYEQAKKAFIEREKNNPSALTAFEKQISYIKRDIGNIKSTFSPNIIEILHRDGTRVSPEEIFKKIFKRL